MGKKNVEKRTEILDFIKAFTESNGKSPTVREIAGSIDRSVSTTHDYLKSLKESGDIVMDTLKKRTVKLS